SDELSELGVGNICFVHIETVDVDAMNRAGICRGMHADFVHIRGFVRPHGKLSTGNPHHALRGRPWCGVAILLGRLESSCRIGAVEILGGIGWFGDRICGDRGRRFAMVRIGVNSVLATPRRKKERDKYQADCMLTRTKLCTVDGHVFKHTLSRSDRTDSIPRRKCGQPRLSRRRLEWSASQRQFTSAEITSPAWLID